MKIITWNCNQALRKKFPLLEKFNADIIVCQESEKLASNFFENYHYQWIGKDSNKGIGILTKKYPYSISKNLNEKFIYYLPLNFQNFNILNVWTHTKADKFGADANGNIIDALDYYNDWITTKKQAIIIGDFNHSIVFDKTYNWAPKFVDIKAHLYKLGFKSSYHSFFNEEFGKEKSPTLFHQKNLTKPFHIDYAFIKGFWVKSVEVGKPDEWLDKSDHMPIIIEMFSGMLIIKWLFIILIALAALLILI